MTRFGMVICLLLSSLFGRATAQTAADVVWIQIEARPTLDDAMERIDVYSENFAEVRGFALAGGWYAIALGPYLEEEAGEVLRSLRVTGRIPRDSYVAQSANYAQQYWPPGEDILALGNIAALSGLAELSPRETPQLPELGAAERPATLEIADTETPAQARRSEGLLTARERRALQTALQWAGYYNATIDGAFGRGTRNAMARWQAGNGLEATGILTSAQRETLMAQYNAILDGLDMALVRDLEAGIEIRLPLGVVAFDRYDAPFAHFEPTGALNARVLLISQTGDAETLASLYEVMQTLRVIPLEGPRQLTRNRFSIVGRARDFVSETEVTLDDGEIKGFTLIWPSGDETRRKRVLKEMRSSFTRRTGVIETDIQGIAEQRADLIAGLEVRRPILSRSGFFVDRSGTVVTSAAAVQTCSRITLDETYDATLARVDPNSNVAVLKPRQTLAPPQVAEFSANQPQLSSEIAVAGYSFEGLLGAPSTTFGTVSDVSGLTGETDINRLSLPALPGDAGGPVFDGSGNVIGMLLPLEEGARRLPEDVRFALTTEALSGVLSSAGVAITKGRQTASLDPQDIIARGAGMTVLVSCWE